MGDVESITLKSGETILSLDTTDPANPELSTNISSTQGDSVNVTAETDGLKVEVEDADTTQKGITQLVTPASVSDYNDETKAITPKGAAVVLDDTITPTTGYLKSYELTQNGLSLGKIDIPKDFLVKEAKIEKSTAYAPNTTYAVDDIIVNTTATTKSKKAKANATSRIYRVKTAISATDNTQFSDVDTVEITSLPPEVGLTIMIFVINVKSGTADNEYLYLDVAALAATYSADEESLTKSSNNVFSINNNIVGDDEKGVYAITINDFGLIDSNPEEIPQSQQVYGVLATGSKTCTVSVIPEAVITGCYAEMDNEIVLVDISRSGNDVTFSITNTVDKNIMCFVNYLVDLSLL